MLKARKDAIIAEYETTIKSQKELIEDLEKRDSLQSESNAGLRDEIQELELDINEIENLIETCPMSAEMILGKIKKLIHDRKSRN